ncbi:MAG TPA: glycosyltransferase, partial [Solirubrobacteraceae bacterium]
MIGSLGRSFLSWLDRRGWVTWERIAADAQILIVTNAWPDKELPVRAVFMRYTVEGLAAAGVEADVLYVRGYRGIHCYALGSLAMALIAAGKPQKYKLVHSHAGETAPVARFFWSAPVLASYWGSDLLGVPEGSLRTRLSFALRARLLRVHSLLMAATTTKSAQMEDVLPARARARNWLIPDGVDRSNFAPRDRNDARRALGWGTDKPIAISVGRPVALKRLWLAERAVDLAAAEVPGLSWKAISDAPPEQMPDIYNAADVLVHTSVSEGSPNVIKEALACNLPVVATSAGDIPELLAGVEPSAISEAHAEALVAEIVRCLCAGRRSNGRDRTASLGLDRITERTLACYRSLGV